MYEVWKQELQNAELEKLSPDFYSRIADYLKRLKEEGRMLDKRTVKARLLRSEVRNAKRMLRELIRARYRKLMKKASEADKVSDGVLTVEEEKILTGVAPLAEAFQAFVKNLFQGRLQQIDVKCEHRNVVLRFLKDVPAIIGADMKPYGPFKVEDVASLPTDNAKILIKQGLADKIEVG
jgi:DNA replication factor GINS